MPNARPRTPSSAAAGLGHLRLAYSWSTRFETLPALGRAFRADHPDVEVLAQEMWNARMPAAFAAAPSTLAFPSAPSSLPSSNSPRYARSAWSRSFRRRIGWRMRRRSRCRRSPMRSSWCSRGDRAAPARRVHGDLPRRRLRAASAKRVLSHGVGPWGLGRDPGCRHSATNRLRRASRRHRRRRAQRTDRLARDQPGLACRRSVASRGGIRRGRALGHRAGALRSGLRRPPSSPILHSCWSRGPGGVASEM